MVLALVVAHAVVVAGMLTVFRAATVTSLTTVPLMETLRKLDAISETIEVHSTVGTVRLVIVNVVTGAPTATVTAPPQELLMVEGGVVVVGEGMLAEMITVFVKPLKLGCDAYKAWEPA